MLKPTTTQPCVVTIMYIFFIIKSHHYMLLPWRACTRDNRTLLLTHHTLWHVLVALATGRFHRNFSDQLLPCTEARFQILCCRIAWQNLVSKLRDFCIYKLLVFSPYHAWGKKERSNATGPLLHRSKRSFCQDHNTDEHNPKPTLTLVSTFVISFPVPTEDSGSHAAAADTVLMLHTKLQSIADLGGGGEKQVH